MKDLFFFLKVLARLIRVDFYRQFNMNPGGMFCTAHKESHILQSTVLNHTDKLY